MIYQKLGRVSWVKWEIFFCKLHLLANFASLTDKVLHSFESIVFSHSCKPVSNEADVASHFNSYLAGQWRKSSFASFIINSFKILFCNAAALYYHADSIKNFIRKFPNPNNLFKAVQEDITNEVFLAKGHAFGIIDKILTAPLWKITGSKSNI